MYINTNKVYGNSEWFDLFPEAKVTHLERVNSDHCHLLLQCLYRNRGNESGAKWHSRFHFESAWAEEERCSEIVTETWGEGGSSTTARELNLKMAKCGVALQRWNKVKKKVLNMRLNAYLQKK
ncbi:hypothetical protein F8388_005388 [Cannabis sativa]|uniref:Uncharacterized protein n=1 Tax=Cannabis sativa TaxID=3483 RepID=A0A7J6EHI4_CANSA|nr:hypothetical protein F8388_005388 [Cannabis sativa]